MRAAKLYSGKQKIISRYNSYHGGNAGPLTATGEQRRNFAEHGMSGYVKVFDFHSWFTKWGENEQEASDTYLAYLEEVIMLENPSTIAAIIIETISVASGVLLNPLKVL